MDMEKIYITESVKDYLERGGIIKKIPMKSCCKLALYGRDGKEEECHKRLVIK